jgi:hypothetical protein
VPLTGNTIVSGFTFPPSENRLSSQAAQAARISGSPAVTG